MTAKANITLYRGDDETRRVKLTQQTSTGEAPFDLTNVARIDLHAAADERTVLQLSTETGEISVLEREQGLLLLQFVHQQTAEADWTEANFDLQLINLQGKIKTVLMGKIKLIHDVTRVAND